jgi:hypothetical protein
MKNTETSNLLTWPVEILQALNDSLDLSIEEERIAATTREHLIRETVDPSQNLLDLWLSAIDKSKVRLDDLFAAKAAVMGAMRIVEKDSKALLN